MHHCVRSMLGEPANRAPLVQLERHPSDSGQARIGERSIVAARPPAADDLVTRAEEPPNQVKPHESVGSGDQHLHALGASLRTSSSTMCRTSVSNDIRGAHPSSALARLGSANRRSTSAGRVNRGSCTTYRRQSSPTCENAISTNARTLWATPVPTT